MWATGVASVSWVLIQELTLSFSPPASQCPPLTCLQQCLLFECSGFLLSLYLPLGLSLSCAISEGLELSPHSLSGSCCGSLALQCPLQLCLMLCCSAPPGSVPLRPLPSSLLSSSLCLPVCLCPLLLALPLIVSVAAICLYQSLSVISLHLSLLLSVFVCSLCLHLSISAPLLSVQCSPHVASVSTLLCICPRFLFLFQDGLSPPTHQHCAWSALPTSQLQGLVFVLERESDWPSSDCGLFGQLSTPGLLCCVWVLDGGAGCGVM